LLLIYYFYYLNYLLKFEDNLIEDLKISYTDIIFHK